MLLLLTVITGPLPPPDRLYIGSADFTLRELTFAWSQVGPGCPATYYNILASNCGSCPTTTNHTNVTCTDVQTDGSACIFAVQTVTCETLAGNESNPVKVMTVWVDDVSATVVQEGRIK